LRVAQPRRGYRWGVEVYALAAFSLGVGRAGPAIPASTAIEFGSGSGVVSLLLARLGLSVRAWERDPAWVALARRSARRSRYAGRVTFRVGDIRRPTRAAPADVVVCNPPWFDPGSGPLAPDARKAAARTMLHGTVQDFVDRGLRLAPRVCVVSRPERLATLRLPGAHVARWAELPGGAVHLAEVRHGAGVGEREAFDVPTAYAFLRGLSTEKPA
jgi:tRNA1Val (adenine37-N6)-methyltransferase